MFTLKEGYNFNSTTLGMRIKYMQILIKQRVIGDTETVQIGQGETVFIIS